eukprot:366522-Chlamydomonas_euryale.AAC.26
MSCAVVALNSSAAARSCDMGRCGRCEHNIITRDVLVDPSMPLRASTLDGRGSLVLGLQPRQLPLVVAFSRDALLVANARYCDRTQHRAQHSDCPSVRCALCESALGGASPPSPPHHAEATARSTAAAPGASSPHRPSRHQ